MKSGQTQPLAVLAGAAMALGVFLPWGRLTITLLEVPVSLEFKGTQIGSDIGDIPWGWFMLAAGVLVIVGALSGGTRLLRVASTAGVVFAVVNALTLHSSTPHASVSMGGETQSLDAALQPHVSVAWGSIAVLIASVVAALSALTIRRAQLDEEEWAPEPLELPRFR